jgi:hypothetical protein
MVAESFEELATGVELLQDRRKKHGAARKSLIALYIPFIWIKI